MFVFSSHQSEKVIIMKKYFGLFIAIFLFLMWASLLVFLLTIDISQFFWLIFPGILFQTFLYTGLFITAHDAIHGSIVKRNHLINTIIGTLFLFVYALFPYNKIRQKHFLHHQFPASDKDPDYHDGTHNSVVLWYFHFLFTYITWWQILGMAIIFNLLLHFFSIPMTNLVVFWILPSLSSTVQLFYFGTFLPHREGEQFIDFHKSRSSNYSILWSFLTCYFFGYHWEHHNFPGTPWWQLPQKRQEAYIKNNHSKKVSNYNCPR